MLGVIFDTFLAKLMFKDFKKNELQNMPSEGKFRLDSISSNGSVLFGKILSGKLEEGAYFTNNKKKFTINSIEIQGKKVIFADEGLKVKLCLDNYLKEVKLSEILYFRK